jgi:hypothetical protein
LDHPIKERWADCVIYTEVLKGGFDEQGAAANLPPVGNDGDAQLIRSAQESFNQNVRSNSSDYSIDKARRTPLSRVDSESEIRNKIGTYRKTLQRDLSINVRDGNCRSLGRTAKNRLSDGDKSWTDDQVLDRYRASVDEVRKAYDSHKF